MIITENGAIVENASMLPLNEFKCIDKLTDKDYEMNFSTQQLTTKHGPRIKGNKSSRNISNQGQTDLVIDKNNNGFNDEKSNYCLGTSRKEAETEYGALKNIAAGLCGFKNWTLTDFVDPNNAAELKVACKEYSKLSKSEQKHCIEISNIEVN